MSGVQQDWSQHLLIKGLCDGKLFEINRKIFSELSKELFTTDIYLQAFLRLDSVYAKQGRFLTWKELCADPSLSEDTRRKLKAKEVKRKSALELDDSLICPKTLEEYQTLCKSILNQARQNSLIDLHNDLSDGLQENMTESEVETLISSTRENLEKLDALKIDRGNLFEVTPENVAERFDKFSKDLEDRMFIPTGYRDFDSVNLGIPRDSLWVIAGKTGSGKSSLCLDVLMNMKQAGARVCLLPLEMSVEQMLVRMGAHLIGVPANEIVSDFKRYGSQAAKAINEFMEEKEGDCSCFDFYEPDVDETLDVSLKILSTKSYDIIAIDYINLMAPMGGEEGWQALNVAGRYAKRFASSNKTCVLFLVQLDDTTNEIRYSRAIKEHASNMWQWSENLYDIMENGFITVKQPKARNQNPVTFKLRADLKLCRYEDYVEMEDGTASERRSFGGKKKRKERKFSDDLPSDSDI